MADKGNTPPGDSEPAKPPAVSDTNHESTDLTAKAPTLEVSGEAGRAHPTSRDENTGDVSENAVKRTPEKSNISVHDAPNPIEMDLAMLDAMEQERQRIHRMAVSFLMARNSTGCDGCLMSKNAL